MQRRKPTTMLLLFFSMQIWLSYLTEADTNIVQDHACFVYTCKNKELVWWLPMEHLRVGFHHLSVVTMPVFVCDLYPQWQVMSSKGILDKGTRVGQHRRHDTWGSVGTRTILLRNTNTLHKTEEENYESDLPAALIRVDWWWLPSDSSRTTHLAVWK